MAANAIPDGYHSVTPYLIVKGADRAIDFYKKVFGAAQPMRMDGPNGTVGHAEIEIDGSTIMLADEFPDMGFRGPKSLGGTGVSLHLYVQDVDACFNRAVAASHFENSQTSKYPGHRFQTRAGHSQPRQMNQHREVNQEED